MPQTATECKIRSPHNAPESIIDNTDPAFISPLQKFMKSNCEHCSNYKGLCRPHDSRGLTPMMLCIALYTSQTPTPEEMKAMLTLGFQNNKTKIIAERTLQKAGIGEMEIEP